MLTPRVSTKKQPRTHCSSCRAKSHMSQIRNRIAWSVHPCDSCLTRQRRTLCEIDYPNEEEIKLENIQVITTFLGWCTVVNLGFYLLTAFALMGFREPIKKIHSSVSAVAGEKLDELYFNYLASFKMAIIILNIAPYAALKLMA